MDLTIRGSVHITTVCVPPSLKSRTPFNVSPDVMPVAAKITPSPRTRSSGASFRSNE